MNERDFDKLFQDKIGDEVPFDFQPADWQNVSRALDNVLPNTPVPSAEMLALTSVKKAWWWAAAAAVILVASNIWLIYQLSDTKREIALLQNHQAAQTKQSAQVVVIHDTIYTTDYNHSLQKMAISPNLTPQKKLEQETANPLNYHAYKPKNQFDIKKIVGNAAQNSTPQATATMPTAANAGNSEALKRGTQPPPQYVPQNAPIPNLEETANSETNPVAQPIYATVAEKYASILKNDLKNDLTNQTNNGTQNATTLIKNNELIINDLSILEIDRLRKIAYQFQNIPSYELYDYVTKTPIKPLKKTTLPAFNGWALGVHKTWLFNQPSYRKKPISENNFGLTVAADFGNNWRVAASFDYWNEYKRQIDSVDRRSLPHAPAPDYYFEFMEIESPLAQVRLGIDYFLPRFGSNQFFIGAGWSKQWLTNPKEKYVFKLRQQQPNPQPSQPSFKEIEQAGSDKNKQDFALLRFGMESPLYRGLGLTANIYSQWAVKDLKDQTWGAQIGLQYRF